MKFFQQALRAALFMVLAFFGLIMALIFMASTILAIGVLYIVARLQGRPFGVKAYWDQRRRRHTHANGNNWPRPGNGGSKQDVIDIEMREIP